METPTSKFTTARSNMENLAETYLSRPTTALQRIVEKISTFRLGPQDSTLSSVYPNDKRDYPSLVGLAEKLFKLVKLMISKRNKFVEQQLDVSTHARDWSVFIDHGPCCVLIKEFGVLHNHERFFSQALLDKMENVKVILREISQREKQFMASLKEKQKLMKVMRDTEQKFGKNSSTTTSVAEKLEVLSLNIEVMRQQRVRAISTDLKESFLDYTYTLLISSKYLQDIANDFMSAVNAEAWEQDSGKGTGSSPPQKENNVLTTGTYNIKDAQELSNSLDRGRTKKRILQNTGNQPQRCPHCEYNTQGNLTLYCKYHLSLQAKPQEKIPEESSSASEQSQDVEPLRVVRRDVIPADNIDYQNAELWGF